MSKEIKSKKEMLEGLGNKITSVILIFILFTGLLAPLVNAQVSTSNVIVGDTIYTYIPNRGVLSQTPHTLTDFRNLVEVEFTSEFPGEQTLDFGFGFDTDNVRPTKAELWCNFSHPNEQPVFGEITEEAILYNVIGLEPIPKPESVDIGTLNANLFYEVWIENANSSLIVGFDSHLKVNDTCYRVFWEGYGITGYTDKWYWDWKTISQSFTKYDLTKNPTFIPEIDKTWWVIDGVSFDNNESKKIRITIDVVPLLGRHEYKYDVFIKRSEDTFKEAWTSGKYVLLDPWILTDWNLRAPLHINNTGCNTALTDYQVFMNVSYQDEMNVSFDDLRVINQTANITVPYCILNKSDGNWTEIYFNVSYLNASVWTNDSYYLYWNNLEASSVSNGTNTFPFFEDFEVDLSKWTEIGTPTINTTQNHSGNSSVKFPAGGSNSITRLAEDLSGQALEWYFYDLGEPSVVWLMGGLGTEAKFIGISTATTSTHYTIIDVGYVATSVPRSDGWHKASIKTDTDITLYIDDVLVRTIVGTTATGIQIGDWSVASNVITYVDDLFVRKIVTPEPNVILGEIEILAHPSIPPTPTNLQNETGTWWVNYTWDAGFEGYYWQNDSAIVSGLTDLGTYSSPTVFNISDKWYMISGEEAGILVGFNFTNNEWVVDTTIINGLPVVTPIHDCDVFYLNDTLYMVYWSYFPDEYHDWHGFSWNGTSWNNDTNITNNLQHPEFGDAAHAVKPNVFEKDNITYMLVINGLTEGGPTYTGNIIGYNWSGTTWNNDTDITNGLPTELGLSYPKGAIYFNETWNLILGEYFGDFYGFSWNGTSWNNDSDLVNGLEDVGFHSAPDVFTINSTFYLISGTYNGNFIGYNWTTNVTDSYNVSVVNNSVETWYNGSLNTSINITSFPFGWVNISVWAYNNTIGNLSLSPATQNTQIIPSLLVWARDESDDSVIIAFYTNIDVGNITKFSGFWESNYTGYLEDEVGYNIDYNINVWGHEEVGPYTERNYYFTLTEPTNMTVYLLKTASGAYINFHVSDGNGYALPGVLVEAIIGNATVENGLTDGSGTRRLFLDPTTTYTIQLSKAGYGTLTYYIIPTSSNYYFLMTTQTAPEAPTEGTVWHFYPESTAIKNETVVFMLNTSSIYGNIEYWNMKIENETTVLFNETKTDAYGGSIISELNLSEYQTGDELYVTLTLKEVGKDPLILYPPYIVEHIYSEVLKETSLYRVLEDLGDLLGDFAKNFLALMLSLFFAGIITKYSSAGAYGGGILSLIFLGVFALFGWVDGWLLMLVGVCAFGAFALMKSGGV